MANSVRLYQGDRTTEGCMDHQHDSADGEAIAFCDSVFDRWRCDLPAGHAGSHRSGDRSQRAEWNDRAAGRRLRDLTRPAEPASRDART